MQKNKSEKIILSAPKTAATLIIAATLNTAPTVARSIAMHLAKPTGFSRHGHRNGNGNRYVHGNGHGQGQGQGQGQGHGKDMSMDKDTDTDMHMDTDKFQWHH